MRYLHWLFWSLIYTFRPTPTELSAYLMRGERTRPPWWTFRPNVYRNEHGKMWQVYLDNESSYTAPGRTLKVELHIGQESGRVVGLNVWDECLKEAADAAGGEHGTPGSD